MEININKEINSIDCLKRIVNDFIDAKIPVEQFDFLKYSHISREKIVNQLVFVLLKKSYDLTAKKKSIIKHLEDYYEPYTDEFDRARGKHQRMTEFIQYYRDFRNEVNEIFFGFRIPELEQENMDDIQTRMVGHQLTNVQFGEYEQLLKLKLLKKIIGGQISSVKKVSNSEFQELFDEYYDYLESLQERTDLTYFEKIDLYFSLEWNYKMSLYLSIVDAASMNNYKEFSEEWLISLFFNSIPKNEWCALEIPIVENRLVMLKNQYAKDLYEQSEPWWFLEEGNFILVGRIITLFFLQKNIGDILNSISKFDENDINEFLLNDYNIPSIIKRIKWNSKKIRYFRQLAKRYMIYAEIPSLK